MQTEPVHQEDFKCLATATSRADIDLETIDNVAASTSDSVAVDDSEGPCCVVDSRRPSSTADVDDDVVERVIPVEANVVLVSRPSDLARDAVVENVDQLGDDDDAGRPTSSDHNANEKNTATCQSTRAPQRRPRKRSSVCNSVDVDDIVIDEQSDAGQSDAVSTVKRTSVSHPRHADTSEHRPKRKGIN